MISASASTRKRVLEAKKAQLPCFHLSQHVRNPDFVGRQDVLREIDKHLLPRTLPESGNAQSSRLFAICGMGGIGKTDLAVEYALSRMNKFGAVFWLEAGGVSQLASDFGRIPTHLGLETLEEALDLETSIATAKAWLTMPRSNDGEYATGQENDSWLLIFDNADNLDIITEYVPYNGNGSVLVTSRDPYAKAHFFSDGAGIDLEPLPTMEAATLLMRLINQNRQDETEDEQEATRTVAKYLDGLPLAMTQMAGFIRRRHISAREFVNLYATDARYAEVHNISNPAQNQRYRRTLGTTFNFDGLGLDATKLLRMLAFLNPDRMQEYIFVNSKLHHESGIDLLTPSEFDDARFRLIASSIIKRNIYHKVLSTHRVVQAEIRTRMTEIDRYETFKQSVFRLAQVWPPGNLSSQTRKRWDQCEKLLPHIERFYQLYTEYSTAWRSFDVIPGFPSLLNEAAV
ncbi:hypothetical protein PG984_002662 [Apiospora sp. TS-2023a]